MVALVLRACKLLISVAIVPLGAIRGEEDAPQVTEVAAPLAVAEAADPSVFHLSQMEARDRMVHMEKVDTCYKFTKVSSDIADKIKKLAQPAKANKPTASSALLQEPEEPEEPEGFGDLGSIVSSYPEDSGIIHLALNDFPKTSCLDTHICVCNKSILHVAGYAYKIKDVVAKDGNWADLRGSLDQKKIFEQASKIDVILEDLPSSTFRISVNTRTLNAKGELKHMDVTLTQSVPAWICVHGGLQVFIGDVSYGCLNHLKITNGDELDVIRSGWKPYKLQKNVIELDDKTFTLTNFVANQSKQLQTKVLQLLQRGNTQISVCD